MVLNKEEKNQRYSVYYLVLIALLWNQSLFEHFRGFLTHVPFVGEVLAPYIIPIITLVLIVVSLPIIGRFLKAGDFLFLVLVISVFIMNYVFFPNNELMLNEYAPKFLAGALPFYIAGVIFKLDETTERVIYWSSVGGLFILVAYYLLYIQNAAYSGETEVLEDMMGPAYAALPFILVIIRKLLTKFDFLSLALSVFGFIFLLSFGARGPIACLLFFVVGYLLFFKRYSKPVLTKGLFIVIGLLCFVFINDILEFLSPIMEALGMGTRIIDFVLAIAMFGADDAMDTSILERQDMFRVGLDYVNVTGHGIGSFASVTHSVYSYSHNIIVDFLIEYGIIIGPLLLLLILRLFVRGWLRSKSEAEKSFILIMFCIGFVSLLFSHTYLIKYEFFFAIGYCVHVSREAKRKIIKIE